ncbi:Periostin like protein [Verticillium longisporum]|nr:Periostin like protein [Verticillium longisporum]KAG7146920.1 Periostin like protein [Verticillium longisporum]
MRPSNVIISSLFGAVCSAEVVDRKQLAYAPTPEGTWTVPKVQGKTTLLDFINSRSDLTTLAKLLKEPAGFTTAFDTVSGWDFTFFAPSNEAFNNTGQYLETYAATAKGKWWLGNLLQHHYIPNTKVASSIFNTTKTRLQTGTYLFIGTQVVDGTLTLNGVSKVTESDLAVERKGVVHIIDRILDPSAQVYEGDIARAPQRFIAGSCSNPALPYC